MNVIFIDFDGVFFTYPDSEELIEERVKLFAYICKKYNCKVVIESVHKDVFDEETMEIMTPCSDAFPDLMNKFKKYGIEVIGRTPTLKSKYHYNKHDKKFIQKMIDKYNKMINSYEEYKNKRNNEKNKQLYDDIVREYELFFEEYPKFSDFYNSFMYSKVYAWKEDEIRIYLMRHPEIEHYAVLDDDDLPSFRSDLDKIRKHVVVIDEKIIVKDKRYYKEAGLMEHHIEQIEKALQEENEVRNYILRMEKKKRR